MNKTNDFKRGQVIPAYIMEYYIRKEMILQPAGRKLIRENGKNTSLVM